MNDNIKNQLIMLTQEDVAELLNVNIMTVSTLRELGIIRAIKTGRNYMFPQFMIKEFQIDYLGLDVSNKVKALRSKEIVQSRKMKNISKVEYLIHESKEGQ